MAKKRATKAKQKTSGKSKSRLTYLFIIKILFGLLSLGLGLLIYSLAFEAVGRAIAGVMGFAAACAAYLFLVINILKILDF